MADNSTKSQQLVRLVEALVRKELKTMLPKIVPQVIREVMAGMILEGVSENERTIPNNSGKRHTLQEVSGRPGEMEEYPTMRRTLDRSQFAASIGYGDLSPNGHSNNNSIMVVPAINERTGAEIPIDPNSLPDHVINALNKDYGPLMQRMSIKKNGG